MHNYKTTLQKISFPTSQLTIETLKDRQQFSDPDGSAEKAGISSATWPLFGIVWPAGLVLANLMSTYNIEGIQMMETGCGLGISSLIIHQRGGDIATSDYHPLVSTFLNRNIKLNQLPPIRHYCCDWAATSIHLGYFDLIIGSDLLYESHHLGLLAQFLMRHTRKGSEVLLVDPGRKQHQKFSRQMEAFGFKTHITPLRQQLPNGSLFKGKLLQYKRCDVFANVLLCNQATLASSKAGTPL